MTDENHDNFSAAQDVLEMTTEIVSSFVANNPLPADHVPDLIRSVYKTIWDINASPAEKTQERQKPAIAVNKSVTADYIVCLEDGKKLKMLKRYLRSNFDMTPDEYRKKWNLPADYPMVAPNYAQKRSDFAKQIGLGKGVRRRNG